MNTPSKLAASCADCRFFTFGLCHLNPPQVVSYVETKRDADGDLRVESYTCTEFPAPPETAWCGQFQSR